MKKIIYTSLIALILVTACSKKGQDCPLQQYHLQCDYRELDTEIGGLYHTGTSDSYFESHCPGDAEAFAKIWSYDSGDTYKHCRIIP